jgi:hypothetical protein
MAKNNWWICQLFLVLAVILVTVYGAAPQLTSLEYTYKRLELIDLQAELTVVTAHFDQDVYVNVSCPAGEPTTFTPCCPVPNVAATGCLPWTTSRPCIDGSTVMNSNPQFLASEYFVLNVSNSDRCHSVNILLRTLRGESWLHVSTRSNGLGEYTTNRLGSEGVSVCCEQLRRDNPSWSGLIYIEHEPRTPSFSQISLFGASLYILFLSQLSINTSDLFLAGYLLPLVDWYFLSKYMSVVVYSRQNAVFNLIYSSASVEVQCSNDYYLSSAACQQQEVCISLPPADDPLSNLVTSIGY